MRETKLAQMALWMRGEGKSERGLWEIEVVSTGGMCCTCGLYRECSGLFTLPALFCCEGVNADLTPICYEMTYKGPTDSDTIDLYFYECHDKEDGRFSVIG